MRFAPFAMESALLLSTRAVYAQLLHDFNDNKMDTRSGVSPGGNRVRLGSELSFLCRET